MTEASTVWAPCRKYVTPYGRWKRIENGLSNVKGVPDVSYTLLRPRGYQGWIELKLFDEIGKCPQHFTRDQILWGEEEVRFGGSWHLFGRCAMVWIIYDAAEARKLFDGEVSSPIFQIQGRFPLQELFRALTTPQLPQLW